MNVAAMPIKKIFLVVGLLVFIPSIHAQIISRPYYNLKNYTTKDGLNSNNCTWVQKDSKGFLWIGSDRGVQRFNGSSFITYRHLNADSNSLVNDYISYIMEDSDHDIWLATADGISKFNYRNGKFTNFSVGYNGSEKVKMGDMFWLLQDSKGRLWAGARSGMFLFNKQTNRFENYPPQKDSSNQPGCMDVRRAGTDTPAHPALHAPHRGVGRRRAPGRAGMGQPEGPRHPFHPRVCTVQPVMVQAGH